MKPLAELRGAERLRGLLFDIDDTLTTEGRLTAEAYGALERLRQAGRLVIAVTGRPAGWCDHIARMWPVDAVVGENGAFYFQLRRRQAAQALPRRGRGARGKTRAPRRDRAAHPRGGAGLRAGLRPGLPRRPTWRSTTARTCAPLPLEAAERIAALMREAGLTARISSIHVNGWFGGYDKLAMSAAPVRGAIRHRPGRGERAVRLCRRFAERCADVRAIFENSIGVANVARFAGRLAALPKYVTRAEAGAGFAELVSHLLGER